MGRGKVVVCSPNWSTTLLARHLAHQTGIAVARSRAHGRVAVVILEHLDAHTPEQSRLLRPTGHRCVTC